MAGKLKSLAEWAGIVQPSAPQEWDDFEPETEATDEAEDVTGLVDAPDQAPTVSNVTSLSQHRSRRGPAPAREAVLDEIVHLRPKSYRGDAIRLAESYRDGLPVIINLSDVDQSEGNRLIDFACGLQQALNGGLEPITHRVFLLTPPSVKVTQRDKDRLADLAPAAAQD
ncbi:MAG: cell division protein SepF [Propionibacteriaceae bacterium]|jgi:cell division inhibitor SepF|nr:cell division protein SepF [Propionibacteriaceae bacterium]